MDSDDCINCRWLGVDSLESEEVCMLNDETPIDEIESCNADEIMYNAESLVIEERRENEV